MEYPGESPLLDGLELSRLSLVAPPYLATIVELTAYYGAPDDAFGSERTKSQAPPDLVIRILCLPQHSLDVVFPSEVLIESYY